MPHRTNAVVVSSPCETNDLGPYLGREHYSYSFALKQFRPLLERWGGWCELTRPESQADFALYRARNQGLSPFHLNFTPLHAAYLAHGGVNAAFVFWEFPDIPTSDIANNPRHNWARIAGQLDRILTASTTTRDAFRRAGVTTPVEVIPVPVLPPMFDIPDWRPDQHVSLDIPCYTFPTSSEPVQHANPWLDAPAVADIRPSLQTRLRSYYRANIRPYLPGNVVLGVQHGYRAFLRLLGLENEIMEIPLPRSSELNLSGVVYLNLVNPFDGRKNWQDLISAFLRAHADHADATLVIKLVFPDELLSHAIRGMYGFYRDLEINHRCKLIIVGGYLSDEQMQQLTRAATYYATATRAEGANLPLMDSLAAGRPGISPLHSSMIDYFSSDLGWVVSSSPELAAFPLGSSAAAATTWHRIDWQSLHDQFRESYAVARGQPDHYRMLSRWARERMQEYASLEQVWPRFRASLDSLAAQAGTRS